MPNIKSAKRVLVSEANNLENKIVKKAYREAVKAFEVAAANKESNVEELYKAAVSSVDKAWSKGVLKEILLTEKASLAKLLAK